MTAVDVLSRLLVVVEVPGQAEGGVVADLFEKAAAVLREHGEITVHHAVFECSDRAAQATTTLSIYYERVERRRHARTEAGTRH